MNDDVSPFINDEKQRVSLEGGAAKYQSGAACRQLFPVRLQHSLLAHAVQSPGNERDAEIVARSGLPTSRISDFMFPAPVRSRAEFTLPSGA